MGMILAGQHRMIVEVGSGVGDGLVSPALVM